MHRRIIGSRSAVVGAALMMTLSACGSIGGANVESRVEVVDNPVFDEGTTMARIVEDGRFRVGIKFDQPGFGLMRLEGGFTGFDVEIAQFVAAGLGFEPSDIDYYEAPSQRREEILEYDNVDMVVSTYTINDRRRERISFAGPYYIAGQQLMVNADDERITGPESFTEHPDATVCSVTGSTPSQEIQPYLANVSQLVLFDVYSKCADALRTGQVDSVTTDNVILLGFVAKSDGEFKMAGEQFTEEPYGIGITKGDVAFCEFINEQVQLAYDSGAYTEAWLDTAGSVEGAQTPELPEFDPCT
ncbi:glutamate ABC transporter substrate-binding protein [Hoyosella subflava]|uniref:Extracellular solute-binding protein family 3 n=1 Tax=Hoyosella subflava (strain DSM 45089 / JCM 17490 / NBRC 109087 / DQS3-9A1) TaxID=443218 RepID=F6EEQ5_HOYSD|nr:glutamate ABC transporter substrate-binding protein [Hoyosella subflava]AEF40855.1 Extracellular solute-binding protein family 3 [Hoyosella subflava DQS3-9A1]